jgi:hypothetical protein
MPQGLKSVCENGKRNFGLHSCDAQWNALPSGAIECCKANVLLAFELSNVTRRRSEREIAPQGLKPSSSWLFSARLKSCPDTKPFFSWLTQTGSDISFAGFNKAHRLLQFMYGLKPVPFRERRRTPGAKAHGDYIAFAPGINPRPILKPSLPQPVYQKKIVGVAW